MLGNDASQFGHTLVTSINEFVVFSASLAVVLIILSSVIFFYLSQRRDSHYVEERHRVELDEMRRTLESSIYKINRELASTDQRWLDLNHLLVSSQKVPVEETSGTLLNADNPFLRGAGITGPDLLEDPKLVFVLTPFHPDYWSTFEVVQNVCNRLGLSALRGDETSEPDVFGHILRQIVRARIVLALIDGRNANVYYELGIANALGKRTIIVSQAPEEAPFDLKNRRMLIYQDDSDLTRQLATELARVVINSSESS